MMNKKLPNILLKSGAKEKKKNTSRIPVGHADDKKLRSQPTKMNRFMY